MELFSGIRLRIARFSIKRRTASSKRKKKAFNITEAKSIGIIFDGTSTKNFDGSYALYASLKNKGLKVSVLAYCDPKDVPQKFQIKEDIEFLSPKDINWYYRPKSETAEKFCKKEFDILINLDLNRQRPLSYISSVSPARFKAGRFCQECVFNDLSIRLDSEPTLEFFIHQLEHYLGQIKSA